MNRVLLLLFLAVTCTHAIIYYAGLNGDGQVLCWPWITADLTVCEEQRLADADPNDLPHDIILAHSPPQVPDLHKIIYPNGAVLDEKKWWRSAALTFVHNLGEEHIPFPTRIVDFGQNRGFAFIWPETNAFMAFFEPINLVTDDIPASMSCGPYKGAPDTVQMFSRFQPMSEHCLSVVAGREVACKWD